MHLRVLRRHLLAVRFLVRLSRLLAATHTLRVVRGKRRHSPPPEEQEGHLPRPPSGCKNDSSGDVASPDHKV